MSRSRLKYSKKVEGWLHSLRENVTAYKDTQVLSTLLEIGSVRRIDWDEIADLFDEYKNK